MSISSNFAIHSRIHDSGTASENPRSVSASNPAGLNVAGDSTTPSGLIGEPLTSAYEKRIHSLQDTLRERDQVVQMLTQRLEQAADQLDRMQRNGVGRGGSIAAGLPPELIESQQSLVEQLTRVLGEWEETQAGETLIRIETQITELRELVETGTFPPANPRVIAASSSDIITNQKPADPIPKSSPRTSVFSDIDARPPAKTSWEAIKAAMMAGENYDTSAASSNVPTKPAPIPNPTVVNVPLATSNSNDERRTQLTLPDPPEPVDFDIADQAMLTDAIRCRDEFISLLLRRLSSPDANTEFPDWDTLNFVPEDLHRELLRLRDRLQDKLRVAEVDLSLQRAKLAREEAKLSIKAEQVARQIRNLGLASDELVPQAAAARPENEGSSATQGRRWLQFLQRSNGSGSGTDGK